MTMIAPRPEPDLTFVEHRGARIAIRHRPARGDQPTVVFLPGYGSDMAGIKARAIDDHCATRGLGCLRLDYSGTGSSTGEFADGTLDRWIDEVLAAIDSLADGNVVLVGSSMGGWIALHAALRRPERVVALLGIAAAPDFTEWGFADPDEKSELMRVGCLERLRPDGSVWLRTKQFWQSGQQLLLLEEPIPLPIPIRLIHGADDRAVPASIALRLFDRLVSPDLQLRLIKGAGHNLSEPAELAVILSELDALVALVCKTPPSKEQPVTQFLHSMLRVSDPQATIDFFKLIGIEERRRKDVPQGRFTLIFLGAGDDVAEVELTHNWDDEPYNGGRNFGHLAFRVDDIYTTCQKLADAGVTINRPPRDGHMAFVRTPDGIAIELLQRGGALAPAEPWVSMPNSGSW